MSFWSLMFTKSRRHYTGKQAQKWRQAALSAGSVREVVRTMIFNTRAQKPPCSFSHRSHLPTPLLCRMAPTPSPMAQHEARRRVLSRPSRTVNGQRFAASLFPVKTHHTADSFHHITPLTVSRLKLHRNGSYPSMHHSTPHIILSFP